MLGDEGVCRRAVELENDKDERHPDSDCTRPGEPACDDAEQPSRDKYMC